MDSKFYRLSLPACIAFQFRRFTFFIQTESNHIQVRHFLLTHKLLYIWNSYPFDDIRIANWAHRAPYRGHRTINAEPKENYHCVTQLLSRNKGGQNWLRFEIGNATNANSQIHISTTTTINQYIDDGIFADMWLCFAMWFRILVLCLYKRVKLATVMYILRSMLNELCKKVQIPS